MPKLSRNGPNQASGPGAGGGVKRGSSVNTTPSSVVSRAQRVREQADPSRIGDNGAVRGGNTGFDVAGAEKGDASFPGAQSRDPYSIMRRSGQVK